MSPELASPPLKPLHLNSEPFTTRNKDEKALVGFTFGMENSINRLIAKKQKSGESAVPTKGSTTAIVKLSSRLDKLGKQLDSMRKEEGRVGFKENSS